MCTHADGIFCFAPQLKDRRPGGADIFLFGFQAEVKLLDLVGRWTELHFLYFDDVDEEQFG